MAVKYEEEKPVEISMTSMMDCIFLMLIFFLVSSQLKKLDRELPVELPKADASVDVKTTPDLLAVTINAKGELFVSGKPVGPAGLKAALRTAAAERPDRRIRVNGDVFAPFRAVVQVLDACKAEGLTVVGIHTAIETDQLK